MVTYGNFVFQPESSDFRESPQTIACKTALLMMMLRHFGHRFQIANRAAQQAPAALVPELESGPKLKTASGS